MPRSREAGSDEEEDAAFLSPEWDPADVSVDQGASPRLRRSSRKRKSTAGGDESMVNGSASKKKKKVTPEKEKMPKVTRSPPKGQAAPDTQGQSFEALLLAMEGRLSAKIERASEASKEAAQQAKLNCEGLEQLESRVDANEECLMAALRETEDRIMARVDKQIQDAVSSKVRDMVSEQLEAAGFDQDLTAADLSVRNSARRPERGPERLDESSAPSYAGMAARARPSQPSQQSPNLSRDERKEAKFNVARRSLRLWPLPGGRKEALEDFLLNKLRLDKDFVDQELGEVVLKRTREPRNKNQDEFIVTFETRQVRDAIKAAAPNLANFRETAGMRLHIPEHLQRDFHALMNLSYDLKKKYPGLKRNVKFDEEDGGLFMDFKLGDDVEWKRVKPAQAMKSNRRRGDKTKVTNEEELESLLGDE